MWLVGGWCLQNFRILLINSNKKLKNLHTVIIFANSTKSSTHYTISNVFFCKKQQKRTTNSFGVLMGDGFIMGRVMANISVLHLSCTRNKSTYLPRYQPPTEVADMAHP
jgi:hypothetical protein